MPAFASLRVLAAMVDKYAITFDQFGKAHDIENLWIADASVLPTSAAVNPSLTIAALAQPPASALRSAAGGAPMMV